MEFWRNEKAEYERSHKSEQLAATAVTAAVAAAAVVIPDGIFRTIYFMACLGITHIAQAL
jgi:hypothetical protein